MTKFILVMFICSHVVGNDCKTMPTPIEEFNNYHKCAIYGYNYSAALLTDMTTDVVDTYRAFTMFNCKENSSV